MYGGGETGDEYVGMTSTGITCFVTCDFVAISERLTQTCIAAQLIGGTQGERVYDPQATSCTLMSKGGSFAARECTSYDLCKGEPRLTEHARCIKARYDSTPTTAAAKQHSA